MDSRRQPASHQGNSLSRTPSLDLGANGAVPFEASEKPNGVEPRRLSATEFPATRSSVPGASQAGPPATAAPLWLMRVWVIIRVAFFIELGMVLIVLPWTRGWTENNLLIAYPGLQSFLHNNFVRGVISGLGFLDIGFGIWEAVRYKEPSRNRKPS